MKKKYTVLLLYPDYMAATFGHDTYHVWVEAISPHAAFARAQEACAKVNEWELPEDAQAMRDMHLLAIYEGHHKDLSDDQGGLG